MKTAKEGLEAVNAALLTFYQRLKVSPKLMAAEMLAI